MRTTTATWSGCNRWTDTAVKCRSKDRIIGPAGAGARPVLITPADDYRRRMAGANNCALLLLQWIAQMTLTAVYMKVAEGYIAFVEELPGANTQGETIAEARANLEEAVAMVVAANRELAEQSLEGADVIRETLTLPAA